MLKIGYLDIGDRTHTVITYAKGNLTKNMAQAMEEVYEQLDYVLDREIGNGKGWYFFKA